MNVFSEIQLSVKLSNPVYGTLFCIDREDRKKMNTQE